MDDEIDEVDKAVYEREHKRGVGFETLHENASPEGDDDSEQDAPDAG